jgi:four helix bundle protein
MKIQTFKDLDIWKLSIEITVTIYSLTRNNGFKSDFSLVDQIRRAVISISSNIAEGFERNNNNEFIQYLRIAKGSTGEVQSQLYIAYRLNYISEKEYNELSVKLVLLSNQIGKFLAYLTLKRKNNEFKTR